jgi:hypothetical protein
VPSEYQIPYAVIGCLSVVQGVASFCFTIHHVLELRSELKIASSSDASDDDSSTNWKQKLTWELDKIVREYRSLAVKSLSLMLEDIPMVRSKHANTLICLFVVSVHCVEVSNLTQLDIGGADFASRCKGECERQAGSHSSLQLGDPALVGLDVSLLHRRSVVSCRCLCHC